MRVAFLIDQLFSPVPGGMGIYVRELLPALAGAERPPELIPFHARFGREPPDPAVRALGPARELPDGIRRLYPSWALLGRPRLPEPMASADVVHTPVPAAIPPAGPGRRLVVTVHDVAFLVHPEAFPPAWRTLYRVALRRAVRRADAIVAPSRYTAQDLIRRAGARPERIHVVPLAPAPAPVTGPVASEPDPILDRLGVRRPFVLSVGTVEPRKNLARLIGAHRRLAPELPHTLVIAGPPGWRGAPLLREVAGEASGRVLPVGRVGDEELDALYRAADCFVYPSLYEGFGLPVLEAMARGTPCVVSSSSSLPEVAGEAALLVDPRSEAELARAIERVLTDPALAARLRAAGPERAAGFTWEAAARGTIAVYESVL